MHRRYISRTVCINRGQISAHGSSFALQTKCWKGKSGAFSSALSHQTQKEDSQVSYWHLIASYVMLQKTGGHCTQVARTLCPHGLGILHKVISWVPTSRLLCKSAALNPLQLFLMGSINLYTMTSYYKSSSSESKINGVYNREHSQRSQTVSWHLFLETHFKCKEQVKNFNLT